MLITSSNNGEFLHLLAVLKRVSVRPQPRRYRDSTIVSQDVDALALQSYIGMDKSLGILSPRVERLRIYDVANILESIGKKLAHVTLFELILCVIQVWSRKWKYLYSWKGFVQILHSLHQLKEEGLRKRFGISSICSSSHKNLMEMYIRYHIPLAPLMYSHRNAFDSGQMYELCINLSIHLCVN
ncbi:hypothetical protein YC2023_111991 [Brassica napus]